MKITVTENMFKDQFAAYGRGDNFSSAGLSALFEYLEDCERDIGEEYELDVIALCCDFTEDEYSSIAADGDIDLSHCEDEEEAFNAVVEYLEENTTVVYSDEDTGMILYRVF